jgi:Core-2/I-Branching enzyme
MAVAYHLLAHRSPEQVARLVRAIWHPENTYVIHYDARRPAAEHAAIQAIATGRPNIIIQPPKPVLWGRYSLYLAQHEGLRLALASERSWSHWINVSGQCYPLIPQDRLIAELSAQPDTTLTLNFEPLKPGGWWPNAANRLTYHYIDQPWLEWWLRLPGIGRRLRKWVFRETLVPLPRLPWIRYRLPTDFVWHGGTNWCVISRKAADSVVSSPAAEKIRRSLRHSAAPDESIFQTVLLNGPFAASVRNQGHCFANWKSGNVASPSLFEPADWPRLVEAAARGDFFARKFASDSPLFDQIDRSLLHQSV